MPRSSKADAIARRDSQPAACSSLMVGAIARLRACACRAALSAARALAVNRTPRSPPSFTPRRLAAARAALVRAETIPASSSATAAICCNRNLPVAPSIIGRSANRTSTPASSRRDRKATERVSRSTLATTSGTWCRRAAASVRLVPWLVRQIAPATASPKRSTILGGHRSDLHCVGRWSVPGRISGATNAAHHPVGALIRKPCQSAAPQWCRAGAKRQASSGPREEDSGGSPCPSCSVRWVGAFNLPTRRTS
jgi:hypothetical protein